jgi:isocitrate/isopropylmalate dehydrogenase
VETQLRKSVPGSVDLVVVRENVEGEYAQIGGLFKAGTTEETAIQTSVFTYSGTERVIRYAFELARRRSKLAGRGEHAGMVTNCSKSNALNRSMVMWDEVYGKVAREYTDIKTDFALVDALTMWFVASIEAMRMLFEHVGLLEESVRLTQATKTVLAEGKVKTRDMGGTASTAEVGDEIVETLK